MKNSILVFSLILFTLYSNANQKVVKLNILHYGVKNDSRTNSVTALTKALQDCNPANQTIIYFPKGRYDFWSESADKRVYFESNTYALNPKTSPIMIENKKNIVFEGQGSEFVFHGRMHAFVADHSENIEIRNLSIDWEIPLNADAEILDVTDSVLVLKINKTESPYVIEKGKLYFTGEGWKEKWSGANMEFERGTRIVTFDSGDKGGTGNGINKYFASEISPGIVKIAAETDRRPTKGNYLVLRHSPRDHAGIFLFHSKNISLEHVDIHNTSGLGILGQYTENISLDYVRMIPNKKKERYLSAHDDGFHVSGGKGKMTVRNCEFGALMDDCINIHGTSVPVVTRLDSKRIKAKFAQNMSKGLEWAQIGDTINYVDKAEMKRLGTNVVTNFELLNENEFIISFRREIPETIDNKCALDNITWYPKILIENSRFLSNRARGVIVKSYKETIIRNNYFQSSGSAILIRGDISSWYESGPVKNLLIENNDFAETCLSSVYQYCEGIISIYPEVPGLNANTPPYHENIRIIGNTFRPFDFPILFARSVKGLEFSNNKIVRSYDYPPYHKRKFSFSFEACRDVVIRGNRFIGDVLGMNISTALMNRDNVKIAKDQGLVFE